MLGVKCYKLNLEQLIVEPTHHKPNCKSSLIDLILTKSPASITSIKHNPPIGKSHHDVITANININGILRNDIKKSEKILKPNFEKANFTAINNYFCEIDWDNLLSTTNVDESWDVIKEKIKFVFYD